MKKQLLLSLTATLVLVGCQSNAVDQQQFYAVQSQMTMLQQKIGQLEGELAQSNTALAKTKGELEIVKKQRVIQLPTGAPIETLARGGEAPSQSDEQGLYQQALTRFRSGDTNEAIKLFKQHLNRFPESGNRNSVLLNLGQAQYTVRDYSGARQSLEALVVKTQGQDQRAVQALKQVYQVQGDSEAMGKLSELIDKHKTLAALKQQVAKAQANAQASPMARTAQPAVVAPAPQPVTVPATPVPTVIPETIPEGVISPEVKAAFESINSVVTPQAVNTVNTMTKVIGDEGVIVTETIPNSASNMTETYNALQSEAVRRAKVTVNQLQPYIAQ